MSNGDDTGGSPDNGETPDEEAAEGEIAPSDVEEFETRLDEVKEDLDTAETEADLDDVEARLDDIESSLETAELPEPDEDEEDAEDPAEEIQGRIDELRAELEEQRGPYLEDVVGIVEDAASTIRETRWTDDGASEVEQAVATFLDAVDEEIDATVDTEGDAADRLDDVAETISGTDLDPDEDAETIAELLSHAETLEEEIEAAEAWDDLTVQEQLTAEGFYDVLTSERRKDYPPEWGAVKLYEKQYKNGDEEEAAEAIEYILLALKKLGSDFMEENILDSLKRIGPPEALDEMLQRAQKRDKHAISVIGKIGDDEAVETFVDFIDGEGDAALQIETMRALGAIGSQEATQAVANRLDAESADVRSAAARTLGKLGDTRAIDPLSDVLGDTDEESTVRASAAWGLNQIGTERALEAVTEHADDASYLVQAEADKATLSS